MLGGTRTRAWLQEVPSLCPAASLDDRSTCRASAHRLRPSPPSAATTAPAPRAAQSYRSCSGAGPRTACARWWPRIRTRALRRCSPWRRSPRCAPCWRVLSWHWGCSVCRSCCGGRAGSREQAQQPAAELALLLPPPPPPLLPATLPPWRSLLQVLALVDVCTGEEELELVKSALAAAVEALPPAARFGLLTFGSQARCLPSLAAARVAGDAGRPCAGCSAASGCGCGGLCACAH